MKNKVPDNNPLSDKSAELQDKLTIKWEVSKEEVWNDVSKQIKQDKILELKPKTMYKQWLIAASLALLLSLGIFIRFHTERIKSPAGTHLTAELPDGSKVFLNADAQITYHPYWWKISRSVRLKGEAFFEVKKGNKFSVVSENGITEVLGTSFNIFARNKIYEVTCVTGKVKVLSTKTKQSVIIKPKQKVSVSPKGELKIKDNVDVNNTKAWISNKFVFTSAPLNQVFEEIERQYNTKIILTQKLQFQYTGSFEKKKSVEETLQLICRPFNLKIEKKSGNYYIHK